MPPGADFADRASGEFGKAIPYGVYYLGHDEGWVSVGGTADTAEFAVESIHRWWNQMGRVRVPEAPTQMITAHAGGSNRAPGTGLEVSPGPPAGRDRPGDPIPRWGPCAGRQDAYGMSRRRRGGTARPPRFGAALPLRTLTVTDLL
jgi:hypothetical protein